MTTDHSATVADHHTPPGSDRPRRRPRTGVRLVLTNPADPSRVDEYGAWYDEYEAGILRPGFLVNAFRFERPSSSESDNDPRYAAIYDIVTRDPATAWPDTEKSDDYPTHLFDDPRSALVAPALRASYALTDARATAREHGGLTGAHIVLTGSTDEPSPERWADEALETGLFYAASRFRLIDGSPNPPEWLQIFETDVRDPLTELARLVETLALGEAADGRQSYSGSFKLVSVQHPGATTAGGVHDAGWRG